jgi:hypothetical protein
MLLTFNLVYFEGSIRNLLQDLERLITKCSGGMRSSDASALGQLGSLTGSEMCAAYYIRDLRRKLNKPMGLSLLAGFTESD